MGGAVSAVTKPITKLAGQVLGSGGGGGSSSSPATSVEKTATKVSRYDEEQGARMRGARRRGRQLLSDARLNPEAGVETLGSSQSL